MCCLDVFSMEVIFVVSISELNMQIILLVTVTILNYIFSALSYFSLLRKRKMSCKFIAFLPIVNTTVALGRLSDSINRNYFKKTFNKFFVLISYLLSIISGVLSLFLLKHYFPDFYDKFLNSILNQNYTLNISHPDFSAVPSFVCVAILICLIVFIISFITNFILKFHCFYCIYREYSKSRSVTYLLLAIVGSYFLSLKFVPALLVFSIRKNTPSFEFLNKLQTSNVNMPM